MEGEISKSFLSLAKETFTLSKCWIINLKLAHQPVIYMVEIRVVINGSLDTEEFKNNLLKC